MNFRCSVNVSGSLCLLLDDVQGNSNKSLIKTELDFNAFLIEGVGNLITITQFLHFLNMGRACFTWCWTLEGFFGCCLFLLHFLVEVPLRSTHSVVGIVSRARRTSSGRPWWYHYLSLGETNFPNTRDCSFFTSQEGLTNFRCLSVIFAPFANLSDLIIRSATRQYLRYAVSHGKWPV